jgi:hypothetical protein
VAEPCIEQLHQFGSGFPGFLAQQPELCERLWLAGLARLEWAMHQLRMAEDMPELSASRILAIPPKLDISIYRLAVIDFR